MCHGWYEWHIVGLVYVGGVDGDATVGNIDDAEINLETAEVVSLVIYGRLRLFGLLGREEDIVVECGDIKVVGSDVVLVKRPERRVLAKNTNIGRIGLKSLLK